MVNQHIRNFLFYGGIGKQNFDALRPSLWRRNIRLLRIMASLAAGLGLLFLIINLLSRSGRPLPYILLLGGSIVTLSLLPLMRDSQNRRELWKMILCYGQMILICGYSFFLSVQQSNYYIPATSAIVFLVILPLSIDDRPIRMFAVILVESTVYILVSRALKSPEAFSLDLMNTGTFCVVGMFVYGIICTRSILELNQSERIEQLSYQTIQTLADAIDAKDPYTRGHSSRVSQYSVCIADAAGWSPEDIRHLRYAALLHDIGKIGVPDSILNKPTRLTTVEYEMIKSHTTMGGDILKGRTNNPMAENVARSHHERYDGHGYPLGLSGTAISPEARIVSLADAFDAMSSNRVYRKACNEDYILRQLKEGRGKQFDPDFVNILIRLWQQGLLEDVLNDHTQDDRRHDSVPLALHDAVETFVSENADLSQVMTALHKSGSYEGALDVEYGQFTRLYEFISNLEKRFQHPFKLVLVTLEHATEKDITASEDLERAMFYMDRAIRISIRDVDVVTQYNNQQFLIIMIGTDAAGVQIAIDRIFKGYFKMSGSSAFSPFYTVIDNEDEKEPEKA